MGRKQQKVERISGNRYVVAAGIGIASVLVLVVVGGYYLGWRWTGLAERTFWDWLQLLVVPTVLALGGYLFTRSENRRAQEIANQRAKDDLEIADQRRQDDLLQTYLDQIGNLLLDKERGLRSTEEGAEARTLARARTLTVLGGLDGDRKGTLVRFLYEAQLIRGANDVDEKLFELEEAFAAGIYPLEDDDDETPTAKSGQRAAVSLSGADLRNVNLRDTWLAGVDLSHANLRGADLKEVYLLGAILRGADLSDADLSDAILIGAELDDATLCNVKLREADLRRSSLHGSDLSGADLYKSHCRSADLSFASLVGANLRNTNFTDADLNCAKGCTEDQMRQASSLEGAIMPDRSEHP